MLKKSSLFLLCLVYMQCFMMFFLFNSCSKNDIKNNFGDDYYNSVSERANINYNSNKYLYNDFSNGIDERFSLCTGTWGNDGNIYHQGNVAENIFLTTDNKLAIRINGDYYRGSKVGNTNGIRTGGAIVTDEDFGPGRYEVRMRSATRAGVCSAFWMYQCNSTDPSINGWNEIDIEIVGGNAASYDRILYTTWQSAKNPNTKKYNLDNFVLNDGEWHVHTFDWYTDYMGTGKGRIDWFIDGKLVYWTDDKVALKSGNIWLGGMRSGEWIGESKFETDWMLTDWIRYIPFDNMNGWEQTGYKNSYNTYDKNFPIDRINLTNDMLNQKIANGGFENIDDELPFPFMNDNSDYNVNFDSFVAVGWKKSDNCKYNIINDSYDKNALQIYEGNVFQKIEGAFEGFEYCIDFYAKNNSIYKNGNLKVCYFNDEQKLISTEIITVKTNEYANYKKTIIAPTDCKEIGIYLSDGYFDNIKCTYNGRW